MLVVKRVDDTKPKKKRRGKEGGVKYRSKSQLAQLASG